MNMNEAKRQLQDVLTMAFSGIGAQRFIAKGKLEYVLQDWPESENAEMQRLSKFEQDARGILGTPYSVEDAGWTDADGNPVKVRVLDEKSVVQLLEGVGP